MLNSNFFAYYPIDSYIHRLNSTVKIIILILTIMALFLNENINVAILLIIISLLIILSKVPLISYIKSIYAFRYMIAIYILLCAVFGVLLTDCLLTTLKLVIGLISIMIITYTTSPIEISNGIDGVIAPFNIFFIKTGRLTTSLMLAIKFIPVFLHEANIVFSSQASRGFDYLYRSAVGKLYVMIKSSPAIYKKSINKIHQIKANMEQKNYSANKVRTNFNYNKVGLLDIVIIALYIINIAVFLLGIK